MHPELIAKEGILAIRFSKSEYELYFHFLKSEKSIFSLVSNLKTFFFNQVSVAYSVMMPQKGDFLIDSNYLFEVGGKGKTFEQIKDIPDSYLAVDDVECGHKNRIPLWMFGLLY